MKNKNAKLISPLVFSSEAGASNPCLGWLEFILTDNQPNENSHGIRKEAFASLVDSGILMPITVTPGDANGDHPEATPIGVISSLVEGDTQVIGKAALWKEKRPEDYALLLEMNKNDEPINISWELMFTASSVDDAGVEWIEDPILVAATIVGNPAYAGRTPVLSVASVTNPLNDTSDLEDKNTMEEELKNEIASLKSELEELKTSLETKEVEASELREYKTEREENDALAAKLEERMVLLEKASLEFSDEERAANTELWLTLSDEAFAAMVDMLKNKVKEASASVNIPDVSGDSGDSPLDIIREGFKTMRASRSEDSK